MEYRGRRQASSTLRKRYLKDCCEECGLNDEKLLALHHINPVFNGGKDTAENLKTVCYNCHKKLHLQLIKDRFKEIQKIATGENRKIIKEKLEQETHIFKKPLENRSEIARQTIVGGGTDKQAAQASGLSETTIRGLRLQLRKAGLNCYPRLSSVRAELREDKLKTAKEKLLKTAKEKLVANQTVDEKEIKQIQLQTQLQNERTQLLRAKSNNAFQSKMLDMIRQPESNLDEKEIQHQLKVQRMIGQGEGIEKVFLVLKHYNKTGKMLDTSLVVEMEIETLRKMINGD